MSISAEALEQRYQTALDAVDALPRDVLEYRPLDEQTALRISGMHAELARKLGGSGAAIAGDLAYRSRPELGAEGLARKTGHRTVENLLENTTGATKGEARTVVNAGTLMVETADDGAVDDLTGVIHESTQPWLRPLAEALAAGSISTAAADAITRGLECPTSAISVAQLEQLAVTLVGQALAGVKVAQLFRNAHDLRLELDVSEVAVREAEGLALRGITHWPLQEGGGMAQWRMDVETYAQFVDVYDRATSPKRGGVRFVDPAKIEKAKKIEDDPRNYKQIASDTFLQLIRLGADADPNVMLGSGAPIIRVTVPVDALETGVGFGRIDGQAQPVSIDTVKRLMETGKTLRAGFDPGGTYIELKDDPLAENRLFNAKQREILAAKFGGCMHPDCDRPPSWTEAHHIQFVKRDGGKTVIVNGILLCKHHHLMYHNDGYEIVVDEDGNYWLIPPKERDPQQIAIPMPLKTRNLTDMRTARDRAIEKHLAEEILAEANAGEEAVREPEPVLV